MIQRYKSTGEPVKVSREVYDSIMKCRESGDVNMVNRNAVKRWLSERKMYKAVLFVHDKPGSYTKGVVDGFEIEDER